MAGQLARSVHQGSTFFAHGIGGRQDLPISFSLVLAGAVAALVVSFGALGSIVGIVLSIGGA